GPAADRRQRPVDGGLPRAVDQAPCDGAVERGRTGTEIRGADDAILSASAAQLALDGGPPAGACLDDRAVEQGLQLMGAPFDELERVTSDVLEQSERHRRVVADRPAADHPTVDPDRRTGVADRVEHPLAV